MTERLCDSGQEVSQSSCQTARNSSPNYFQILGMECRYKAMDVGPCHHSMARPRVADGGMASYMEGSCE